MENIRHSCFETNSSSTHSISICEDSDGVYDTIVPDENGVICLTGGQFGWDWIKFNDPLTKANYLAVQVSHHLDMTRMLFDVIKEHTGALEVKCSFSSDYESENYSYIDHESVGVGLDAFESTQKLKNFIFNPKSFLITGNDNELAPPHIFSDKNNFEISVESFEDVYYWENKPSYREVKHALYWIVSNKDREYGHDKLRFAYRVKCVDTSKVFTSLDLLNEGKIVLFASKTKYDKNGTSLGEKIIQKKVLNVSLINKETGESLPINEDTLPLKNEWE